VCWQISFKCIDTPFYHTNSARIIAISYDKVQSAMNSSDLSQKIANLKVWKSNGQRAPHKPLLLLLALSRIQQNKPRMMLFAEIEKKLTELLTEFGPQRKIYYPEEPFCRLRTEGFWELSSPENIILPKGSFSKTTLRQKNISAGFQCEKCEHSDIIIHSIALQLPRQDQYIHAYREIDSLRHFCH